MNEYVTDDEQVERIKKWWSDNGSSVVAGLVIGIGGLMGWRYWVDYKDNQAAEASRTACSSVARLTAGCLAVWAAQATSDNTARTTTHTRHLDMGSSSFSTADPCHGGDALHDVAERRPAV